MRNKPHLRSAAAIAWMLAAWAGLSVAAPPGPPVDINSASRAQLKTLPGIDDAAAGKIVAGRPYLSKAELVSAKAIPAGTYLSIKRLIVAKPPPARPKSKPNGKA